MKPILKVAGIAVALVVMLVPEVIVAQAGHMHRATRRRTAVVVGTSVHAADASAASAQQQQAAASQQQAAATTQAQQQTTAAQQQTAEAQAQTAAAQQQVAVAQQQAAAAAEPLPVGTVALALPAGCAPITIGGVQYQHCGNDYYRAVFQGNTLVYVTTEPPQ